MRESGWMNSSLICVSTRGEAPARTGDRDSISPNTLSAFTPEGSGSARNTRRREPARRSSSIFPSSRRRWMFKVLIADEDFEDRELLKLEIQRALEGNEPDLRFHEAVSAREAVRVLAT